MESKKSKSVLAPKGAIAGKRYKTGTSDLIWLPHILTSSSDMERWFGYMEMYFWAAQNPIDHRAALVQVPHTFKHNSVIEGNQKAKIVENALFVVFEGIPLLERLNLKKKEINLTRRFSLLMDRYQVSLGALVCLHGNERSADLDSGIKWRRCV
ncbi:hypothetical protein T07_15073 [Trichinella nelsoni]|uniref:Uncharacterized protein n=1 Tax=Trichinella nelsoni TaxID=6336 RepID=A0A0V0RV77_9BILA|nr:hypothetical protein T07_15073 [Trichinella nelsoni]